MTGYMLAAVGPGWISKPILVGTAAAGGPGGKRGAEGELIVGATGAVCGWNTGTVPMKSGISACRLECSPPTSATT